MRASKADRAYISIANGIGQTPRQAVDVAVCTQTGFSEALIYKSIDCFKIGNPRKRDAMFTNVLGIFGGIELDLHCIYCIYK